MRPAGSGWGAGARPSPPPQFASALQETNRDLGVTTSTAAAAAGAGPGGVVDATDVDELLARQAAEKQAALDRAQAKLAEARQLSKVGTGWQGSVGLRVCRKWWLLQRRKAGTSQLAGWLVAGVALVERVSSMKQQFLQLCSVCSCASQPPLVTPAPTQTLTLTASRVCMYALFTRRSTPASTRSRPWPPSTRPCRC